MRGAGWFPAPRFWAWEACFSCVSARHEGSVRHVSVLYLAMQNSSYTNVHACLCSPSIPTRIDPGVLLKLLTINEMFFAGPSRPSCLFLGILHVFVTFLPVQSASQ